MCSLCNQPPASSVSQKKKKKEKDDSGSSDDSSDDSSEEEGEVPGAERGRHPGAGGAFLDRGGYMDRDRAPQGRLMQETFYDSVTGKPLVVGRCRLTPG